MILIRVTEFSPKTPIIFLQPNLFSFMFQTIPVRSNNKGLHHPLSGYKDTGIRNLEFVAKSEFLLK